MCCIHKTASEHIYIHIYAFSRRFYPKQLPRTHSSLCIICRWIPDQTLNLCLNIQCPTRFPHVSKWLVAGSVGFSTRIPVRQRRERGGKRSKGKCMFIIMVQNWIPTRWCVWCSPCVLLEISQMANITPTPSLGLAALPGLAPSQGTQTGDLARHPGPGQRRTFLEVVSMFLGLS